MQTNDYLMGNVVLFLACLQLNEGFNKPLLLRFHRYIKITSLSKAPSKKVDPNVVNLIEAPNSNSDIKLSYFLVK